MSWGMRGIRKSELQFMKGHAWAFGNGANIGVFKDKWVNGRIPEANLDITLRQEMRWKVDIFINKTNWTWKERELRKAFNARDAVEIGALELPGKEMEDLLHWNYTNLGKFNTKSGYAFLISQSATNERVTDSEVKFLKFFWHQKILPKWKIFVWKIFYNGLAVKSNLNFCNICESGACEICGEEESINHTLRLCIVAKRVWQCGSLGIISSISPSISIKEWIKRYIQQFYSFDGKGSNRITTFLATIWEIWLARNEFSFHGTITHITRILERVKSSMQNQNEYEHNDYQELEFLHPPEGEVSSPPGYQIASIGKQSIGTTRISIQIDGAWDKATKRRGAGWVLEYDGIVTNMKGCFYGVANSALQAETIACLEAITWCWEADLQSIIIKTDASKLVDILQGKGPQEKILLWTINEIGRIGHNLEWCIIRKEQRSKVEEAHKIAKMAAPNAINSRPATSTFFNNLA